jgi:hypothetical protein
LGKLNKKAIFLVSITALLALVLLEAKVLSSHEWNPRAFIVARDQNVSFSRRWGIGYDGQFTYSLATQPWGSVENLDQPAFRYQRILYPLLVRLLSLNNSILAPWTMILINLVAAAFGCAATAWLLQRRGASPWLALVLIFSLGYLLAIRMDLNEPVALALALWGLVLYQEDKLVLAIIFFAISGLAKEIALVFPVALAMWEALHKHWRRSLAIGLGSLSPYLVWYLIVNHWFGVSQVQIEQSRPILIPFWGIRYLKDAYSRLMVGLWVLLPAIIGGLLALINFWKDKGSRTGRDALLVLSQVCLVAFLPKPTWEDPIAVLRVALGLLAAILVWLAGSRPRLLPYTAALWAPSGLVLFMVPNMI